MSEHSVGSSESVYPDEETYFSRRLAVAESGAKIWIARNFNTDTHVYGLWHGGREVALVSHEDDYSADVYVLDREGRDTFLGCSPTLIEGVEAAERYWGV